MFSKIMQNICKPETTVHHHQDENEYLPEQGELETLVYQGEPEYLSETRWDISLIFPKDESLHLSETRCARSLIFPQDEP